MALSIPILISQLCLTSSIFVQIVTSVCVFPQHLQRHKWHHKIYKSQNKQNVINFDEGIMVMREQTIRDKYTINTYTYHCEEMMDERKYLVSDRELEKDGGVKYKCIELLKISSSVYQLRMSKSSSEKENICSLKNLPPDPWPMISLSEMDKSFITCPFSGGYNMKIWDSRGHPHGCNSMDLPMRFETECITGEGISFNFRKEDCLDSMPMEKFQKAFCYAHWKNGNYSFIVLKKAEDNDVWIMRVPRKVLGSTMTVELFTDVIAYAEHSIENVGHFSISLEKVQQLDLCADEYRRCETMTCNAYLRDQCPKTCQKCNQNIPTPVCTFPTKLRGDWFLRDQFGFSQVNISESLFQVESIGKFKCVAFSDSPSKEENKYTTVSIFKNGCRPRYTCLNFHRLGSSVVGFALSQSFIWPLNVDNPGTKICDEGRFEPDPSPLGDSYRSYLNSFKPLLPGSRPLVPIACDIQSSFSFHAKIPRVGRCSGYMYKDCTNTSILQISFNNCHHFVKSYTYVCAANIGSSYWEKIILLQNAENYRDGGCLAFTQLRPDEAILLPPGQCDTYSWQFVESKVRTPLIHFTVRTETASCRDMPTTTITSVKDSMVAESPNIPSHRPNSAYYKENGNLKERTPSYVVTPEKSTSRNNNPGVNVNTMNIRTGEHSNSSVKNHPLLTNYLSCIFMFVLILMSHR